LTTWGADATIRRGHVLGTFTVDATFRNPHDRAQTCLVPVLVDTGATWTALPADVVAGLGGSPLATRRVRLANGREEAWPFTIMLVEIEGQELPTVCLIGPHGGPALLGAVTLEEFALSVDPVARRLVPVAGYLMACLGMPSTAVV
jgi:clan AA aspartic protease